jgi:hypothetical protein
MCERYSEKEAYEIKTDLMGIYAIKLKKSIDGRSLQWK